MIDVDKLLNRVKSKGKPDGVVGVEVDASKGGDSDDSSDYNCGDRAIAASKLGDGEAFEQAIMDIFDKYQNQK